MTTKPPLKLDLFVGFPSYGGNGGVSSEVPNVRDWYAKLWARTFPELREEGRLGQVHDSTLCETPIPMVRNRFVTLARQAGAHLLVTIDSDMNPGLEENKPWFKPFFETAFDAIYEHYHKGPLVIGAPYCGPPDDDGGENVYIFHLENHGWHGDETRWGLSQYSRYEAEKMAGVSEVAALPTGLIMYDMRIFDLLEPSALTHEQILTELQEGRMTKTQALSALQDGWFFYEWNNQYVDKKGSTEDVASTRNMAFMGITKLGYNPLRCAWDSWAGHWKPWCVGRPRSYTAEHISAGFRKAIEEENSCWEVERDFTSEWQDAGRKVNFASPFPPDFPKDLLESFPERSLPHFSTRNIFGTESVMFLHATADEHLKALRNLVKECSIAAGRKLRIVEVGSWLGDSAIAMGDPKYCEYVTCVDTWQGSASDQTRDFKNAIGCDDRLQKIFSWNIRNAACKIGLAEVRFINLPSVEAADEYQDNPADIIFIDADHTYESCKADIEAWLPNLSPDGVMIGHDYKTSNDQFPGVDNAVHELFGDCAKEYHCTGKNFGGFWVVHMHEYLAKKNGKNTRANTPA
jgi:predicted O-methyltransferase YrrM